MSKEPGQMAYEAARANYLFDKGLWRMLGAKTQETWARVESAIRADEAAKVREECAKRQKIMQSKVEAIEARMGRKTSKLLDCAEALISYLDDAEERAKFATDALVKAHADLKVAHFGKGFEYNIKFIAADLAAAIRAKGAEHG